jgi:hypothetical protein
MSFLKRSGFIIALACVFATNDMQAGRVAQWLVYKKNDFLFDFKADSKTEAVYAKNCEFFSGNQLDQYFYAQSTWDFTTHTRFADKINSKITLRSKARWGGTRGIETTAATSVMRLVDVTMADHTHGFNRLVPFIRKAWVKFCLNDAFDINTIQRHYFKFGAFPFQVGRGISLGSAYAVSPGMLGFFTDNSIDQYAFGALLHGDMSTKLDITYDAYASMVDNESMSLSQNAVPVYLHEVNRPTIYRGYGAISYILAGRLFWTLFDNERFGTLTAEPYAIYYRDPHNKNEYRSDGDVKLGTMGFSVEYEGSRFQFGWEFAANTGHQLVRAWDRNYAEFHRNATTAAVEEIYSAVYEGDTKANGAANALMISANKTTIEKGGYGAAFNNQKIGDSNLYNGPYRFRKSYKNLFGGQMVLADAAYWLRPKELKIAATVGYASGDEHPNVSLNAAGDIETTDVYSGFIGLQEIYSGKRVRSLFVLGSQSIVRPLTAPDATVDTGVQRYAANTPPTFTNLVYTGVGLTWTPQGYKRTIKINPNVLYYWQDIAVKKYCLGYTAAENVGTTNENASKAIGLELNTVGEVNWLDNLKGFAALGVFIPGKHYKDIIGKPVNQKQLDEVNSPTRRGIDCNAYPLLNNKTAFLIDIGFEYQF